MSQAAAKEQGKPKKDLDTCVAETRLFVQKVVDRFDLKFNPDAEVNETVIQGLARNQHLHNKRYCPCFLIQHNRELDRVCPCKPGLEEEVPRDGHCHCGIFCAPDFSPGAPYAPAPAE
ncbi:MAG: ferredoxin-thioredoxin reductase [Nitrospirota bacterium]|nr:ferredoxin-thioredoxin reductase [Nitrospirota bacterium]